MRPAHKPPSWEELAELARFHTLYQASRKTKCFLQSPGLQEVVLLPTNEVLGEKSPMLEVPILGNLEKSKCWYL